MPPGRPSARERGYTRTWEKARRAYLALHPLCTFCRERGWTTPATVLDHIVPHKGDMSLFWDETNWQPLCATCHSSAKQRLEATGVVPGCDEEGVPLDSSSHWRG